MEYAQFNGIEVIGNYIDRAQSGEYKFGDIVLLATKGQLEGVQKKLDNLAQAIVQGIFSSTTKKLLDDLEEQKQKLEIELFEAETRHPTSSSRSTTKEVQNRHF